MGACENYDKGVGIMNNSSFVFTGLGFILMIPAMLLVASFSIMMDQGTDTISTQINTDNTFVLFRNLETDMKNVLEISGRRSAIATVDFIIIYAECLNSSSYSTAYGQGPEGALKELLIDGTITGARHSSNPDIMTDSTLPFWGGRFVQKATDLGYNVTIQDIAPEHISIVNTSSYDFIITWRVYVNITGVGNSSFYSGPIPRQGNLSVSITGNDLGGNIFNC